MIKTPEEMMELAGKVKVWKWDYDGKGDEGLYIQAACKFVPWAAQRLIEAEGLLKEFISMYDDGALCCDCVQGLTRKCGQCGVKETIKKSKKLLKVPHETD
jgi:hypothetical protein